MRRKPIRSRAVTIALVFAAVAAATCLTVATARPAEAGAGARATLDRALKGLKDARATFKQVRVDELGTTENRGSLEYRTPRQVRLEYTGRVPMTILVQADTAWVYQPAQKQVMRTRASRAGVPPLPFLDESVATLERSCIVRETGPRDLVLEPREAQSSTWRSVALTLDGSTGLPSRVVVRPVEGGTVTLTFSRFSRNTGLSASRFAPRFPADVRLVEL
ncbi:MAG: LolA family protein [Candidatus Eiseniibacteriota bacterium]